MMRYVGLKYVEIWDRGEDEFKDQPRLINYFYSFSGYIGHALVCHYVEDCLLMS